MADRDSWKPYNGLAGGGVDPPGLSTRLPPPLPAGRPGAGIAALCLPEAALIAHTSTAFAALLQHYVPDGRALLGGCTSATALSSTAISWALLAWRGLPLEVYLRRSNSRMVLCGIHSQDKTVKRHTPSFMSFMPHLRNGFITSIVLLSRSVNSSSESASIAHCGPWAFFFWACSTSSRSSSRSGYCGVWCKYV